MGHYASEMPDDKPEPREPKPKKSYLEKERSTPRGWSLGKDLESDYETVQYAYDYDGVDRIATKNQLPFNNDPDRDLKWWLSPQRDIQDPVDSIHSTEEREIKTGQDFIRLWGQQDQTKRPGKILRRTVTYGPWEEVAEEGGHAEGWY